MNSLDLSDVVYVSNEIHKVMKRTHLREGDVLLNITGASIGRVAPFMLKNIEANVNQHVCIIRVKPSVLSPKYLSYFLSSPRTQSEIAGMQRGGTRQALTFGQIADFVIPAPSLQEQLRISEILNAAVSLCESRKQAIEILLHLGRSLFIDMFGDPATNPQKWHREQIVNLCLKIVDCPHSTPKYSETVTSYPCIRSSDIQDGQLVWESTKYVDEDEYQARIRRHRPQVGDVIYCREGARFGNAAVIPPNCTPCLGQRTMLLTADGSNATGEFLSFLLNSKSVYKQIQLLAGGSASPHVNVGDVKKLTVFVPPIELQRRFSERLRSIGTLTETSVRQSALFDNLFDTLLARSFDEAFIAREQACV